jgi:hypothetical protein
VDIDEVDNPAGRLKTDGAFTRIKRMSDSLTARSDRLNQEVASLQPIGLCDSQPASFADSHVSGKSDFLPAGLSSRLHIGLSVVQSSGIR